MNNYIDDIEAISKEYREERQVSFKDGSLYESNNKLNKKSNDDENDLNNQDDNKEDKHKESSNYNPITDNSQNKNIQEDKDKNIENKNTKLFTNEPQTGDIFPNQINKKDSEILDKKNINESYLSNVEYKNDINQKKNINTPDGKFIIPDSTYINNNPINKILIGSSNVFPHNLQNSNNNQYFIINNENQRQKKVENKVPNLNPINNEMNLGINNGHHKFDASNGNNNELNRNINTNNDTPKENIDINKPMKNNSESNKASKIFNVDDKAKIYVSASNMIENNLNPNPNPINSENREISKNYEDFKKDKNYYLACPDCKKCIPHIETVDYDSNKKDFIITYICPCNKSINKINKTYFIDLIVDYDPQNYCPNHKSRALSHFCKDCNYHVCEQCIKEEHDCHTYEYNINIISPENTKKLFKKANEQKVEFKGFDLINKIFEIYLIKNNNESNISISRGYKIPDSSSIHASNVQKLNQNVDNNPKIDNSIINKQNNENNNESQNNIVNNNNYENEFQNEEIDSSHINDPSLNNNNIKKENDFNCNNNNLMNGPEFDSNLKDKNEDVNNKIKLFDSNDNNDINSKKKSKTFIITDSGSRNMQIDINKNNENKDFSNNYNDKYKNISNDFIDDNNNINKSEKQNKLTEYKNTQTLTDHTDKVVSLIQLNSGYIVTGSYDQTIKVWDIKQGKCILSLNEKGYVFCLLEFEPNKILAGNSLNTINLWDIQNPTDHIFSFIQHELWVNCLVKCDSNFFASCSNDAMIYIWDYYKKISVAGLRGHLDCILTLIKLNDGKLCSGSADSTIKIWDWKRQCCVLELKTNDQWIKSLYQLNDGTLLSGALESSIKLYQNNKCVKIFNGHTKAVRAFCQIDDNHFASGSFDNTIKIWDKNTGEIIQDLRGHTSNVICVIKLKDNTLASCSTDKTIKVWK
jgi:WD40 repeat protein